MKLDCQAVLDGIKYTIEHNGRAAAICELERLQVAIFTMAGGGFIGRMYAEQPADAYVDSRAGRRPYGMRDLEAARVVLCCYAKALDLDAHHLPKMLHFHNCGIF